jgi:hypothetical protein
MYVKLDLIGRELMIGGFMEWYECTYSTSTSLSSALPAADQQNTSLITPREVDHLPRSGLGLALSISDPHNPQPYLPGDISNYLLGTNPTYETKRGEVEEDVYGIWVDRGRGIVVSPLHHLAARVEADVVGFALLDILSVQLWQADSAWMAWAS